MITMDTVTISPEFQVEIPLAIREALGIEPGQEFQVIQYGNRVELIPKKLMREARGMLKGIDTTIVREPDRL